MIIDACTPPLCSCAAHRKMRKQSVSNTRLLWLAGGSSESAGRQRRRPRQCAAIHAYSGPHCISAGSEQGPFRQAENGTNTAARVCARRGSSHVSCACSRACTVALRNRCLFFCKHQLCTIPIKAHFIAGAMLRND